MIAYHPGAAFVLKSWGCWHFQAQILVRDTLKPLDLQLHLSSIILLFFFENNFILLVSAHILHWSESSLFCLSYSECVLCHFFFFSQNIHFWVLHRSGSQGWYSVMVSVRINCFVMLHFFRMSTLVVSALKSKKLHASVKSWCFFFLFRF